MDTAEKKELEMADIKVRTVGEMRQAILSEAKKRYIIIRNKGRRFVCLYFMRFALIIFC